MRPFLFLTRRTLHKVHQIVLLHHLPNPNPTPKLNPYVHFNPCNGIHVIPAYYQTRPIPLYHNSITLHQNPHTLISLPEFDEYMNKNSKNNQNDQLGIDKFVKDIQKAKDFTSGDQAIALLDDLGIKPNQDFIFLTIWALREEWKLAFLVFKWGQKYECCTEKSWNLLVWLLGNHEKFSTAWSVICDLHSKSMGVELAMLILIDRYAAAECPGKAIETFETMEKFRLFPDLRTFLTLLNILCKHGNIEEAEVYLLTSKKLFPLEAQSFNIILNGWCNVAFDPREAKRIWRDMLRNCVLPDGVTYMHMISCYAKVGNLHESLRLYDEMQTHGWIPGVEVYNSLLYVLTRENCLNEALKVAEKMKETGLLPNSSTVNSMVLPLCDAMKSKEAKIVLAMMIVESAGLTIDTYHAFLRNANLETTLEMLNYMKKASLGPTSDTFLIVLENFFKLKQPGNALRIWEQMDRYNIIPQSAHYNAMIAGLENDLLIEALRFNMEMVSKGMIGNPKFHKLVAEPVKKNSSNRRHITGPEQRTFWQNNFNRSEKPMKESRRKRRGAT